MTYKPSEVMVEAAARAIWAIEWPAYSWPERQAHIPERDRMLKAARAALEAAFAAAVEKGEARFVDNGLFRGLVIDESPLILRQMEGEK